MEAELARPTTVLLVEDVHWADDATLDVLRFLARRIADLPALLVLTYRDDELGRGHPLHRVLGALGGERVHRLRLSPLSRAAVARLAGGTTATSARLYALTAGNPFFVTEVARAPAPTACRPLSSTPCSPGSARWTGRCSQPSSSSPWCPATRPSPSRPRFSAT